MANSKLTPEVRKLLWTIMIDEKMAGLAREDGIGAVAKKAGIKMSDQDLEAVSGVDLDDVTSLLSAVDRDLTLVMGGSRPRRSMALSDGAILELQDALKDIRRTDD